MNQIFIIQNQDNLFFGKNKEWVDGYDAASLFKAPYKDEAINQMVEISSKDYTQRLKVVACNTNEKGMPVIDINIMASPLPKTEKPRKTATKSTLIEEKESLTAFEDDEDVEDALEFSEESLDEEPQAPLL